MFDGGKVYLAFGTLGMRIIQNGINQLIKSQFLGLSILKSWSVFCKLLIQNLKLKFVEISKRGFASPFRFI